MRFPSILRACAIVALLNSAIWGAANTVPDSGGTALMPIRLDYVNRLPDKFKIIDGLPIGTTVESDVIITSPSGGGEAPPAGFGATSANGFGMNLVMFMQGTGGLAGYNRNVVLPTSIWAQNNNARTPGNPIQSFDTDLFQMQAQLLPGDPDFDLLRISAGGGFGLPSPGHTTLTQDGPNWAVDSFFDITYRIDFVGHPGSPFGGRSGSTTGTARVHIVPEPAAALVGAAGALVLFRRRRAKLN